ncbi:MAG: prepilin peptidase [candidate division Zixibacteria bacterium]|nr:prepilin peptidase [candidate division Zixibacteria bacterium]
MNTAALVLTILTGLVLGSFLNVCIYRIPKKESIFLPSSSCPKCGAKIRFYDNIPLLSYVILRGRCRDCKAGISLQYPLIEFLTSALLVLAYLRFGLTWDFAARGILILFMIVTFFIDLKHRIIPDVLTFPGIVVGFILSFAVRSPSVSNSLLGIFVGGAMFYLAAILGDLLFKKESMGGGDIKLAMMLGAFLGWKNILLVFFLSAFLGSLIGVIALFFSKDVKESRTIPFGPFLAVAAVIAMFIGDAMIAAYLRTFF